MAETSTLENLVLELDPAERASLLSKLGRVAAVPNEPLRRDVQASADRIDYAAEFRNLGFLPRLLIVLKSVFTGVSREEVMRERILRSIGREAESQGPGLADTKRKVFLEPFRDELSALRGAARYFYDLLDKTLEKSRGEFFAFLASLQFEQTHQELSVEADPHVFLERNALATDADIRTAINAAFESALSRMDEDHRRLMLQDVRNLHALKKLSGFLFDRLINGFQTSPSGRRELSFYAAADQLEELASVLLSLDPPSPKVMEAILAFVIGDQFMNQGAEADEAVRSEMANATKALSVIRGFNARVPLAMFLRVANEDPNWHCPNFSGGEDWFALFKAYWKDRIDKRYQKFIAERRIRQLDADIVALIGADNRSWLEHVSETGAEAVPPLRFARAIRFLESFYHGVFLNDINKVLKVVLLDGEFYKRDNRLEFTDAYNSLLQTGEALKNLDKRLAPDGELGATYYHAKNELIPVQIKKRKVESAVQAAETEAETLLRRANDAMTKMQLILKGILQAEARGRYDSLANLSSIDGKANKDFQKNLELAKNRFEKAVYLMGELSRVALSVAE
ncbi:MAG: hypothetical protein KBB32_00010 [Spirochaetia bacterium]|nr:hypothetical protein [Spirochaetia bacterium]